MFKFLLFLTSSFHFSSADTHSLQFLYTDFRTETNYPEFTAVGLLDREQIVYYDSNITKLIPKTEWIQKIKTEEPDYWNRLTHRVKDHQVLLEELMFKVKHFFNQTKELHTLQRMFVCERDVDVTTRGYDQYGYDGEDFFSLNVETGTWTAANNKAENFINQWDPKGERAKYWKNFLETNCEDQLQKFVSYSKETLKRKDPPTVSVFHKHSPSPEVVCHATGFFPSPLTISWRKDGEDVLEDVELRETLPNQDGSFQRRSILKVSAEELQKHTYTCVIQHSSLEQEMVKEIPKGEGLYGVTVVFIVVGVIVGVVIVGILVWKLWLFRIRETREVQQNGTEFHPLNVC